MKPAEKQPKMGYLMAMELILARKRKNYPIGSHSKKDFMSLWNPIAKGKCSWKHDKHEINKHVKQWFTRKLGSITKMEVQDFVENIAVNGGKTQANHILERIRANCNKLIF
jgi:DNA integrity scanning protein DisA with diadenylate cyclase activity